MLLPGTSSSASFDDPMALLHACHGKVRHFAGLALRLAGHVASRGADADASAAAGNILRYFDIAAPLHHADEEEDLFPALRQLALPELDQAMAALEAEHVSLAVYWAAVRRWLQTLLDGTPSAPPPELSLFASSYPAHADHEEATVYGYASQLDAATLNRLGRRMAERRGAKFDSPSVSRESTATS